MQDGAQNEEVIHDMKNVTKKLLMKFHDENKGRKPEKIVMYRDGASEGQFLVVLAAELVAMREACQELEEGYKPEITQEKIIQVRPLPLVRSEIPLGCLLYGPKGMLWTLQANCFLDMSHSASTLRWRWPHPSLSSA